jgi:hypothetical protein
MNDLYKLSIVNLFLIASVVVAFFYGYVSPLFVNDVSHISYVIAFIIASNVFLAFLDCRAWKNIQETTPYMRWLQFASGKLPYIGLIGTLIGFRDLVYGLNGSGDPAQMIISVREGCLTLANTTILGLVGFLWVNLNFYLVGEE